MVFAWCCQLREAELSNNPLHSVHPDYKLQVLDHGENRFVFRVLDKFIINTCQVQLLISIYCNNSFFTKQREVAVLPMIIESRLIQFDLKLYLFLNLKKKNQLIKIHNYIK